MLSFGPINIELDYLYFRTLPQFEPSTTPTHQPIRPSTDSHRHRSLVYALATLPAPRVHISTHQRIDLHTPHHHSHITATQHGRLPTSPPNVRTYLEHTAVHSPHTKHPPNTHTHTHIYARKPPINQKYAHQEPSYPLISPQIDPHSSTRHKFRHQPPNHEPARSAAQKGNYV